MPVLVIVLLGLIWIAITGSVALVNIIFGLALGALVLFLMRDHISVPGRTRRPLRILHLAGLFVYELVLSGWRVMVIVLRRDMALKPGIIVYPLRVQSDFEIALLANLITLTPGTLTLDVTPDRRHLVIHAIDCADPDQIRADTAAGFERRIMEAFG